MIALFKAIIHANKAKCQLKLFADGQYQCRRLLNKPNWQFKSCNIPMIGLCMPIYFTACVVINNVALYIFHQLKTIGLCCKVLLRIN